MNVSIMGILKWTTVQVTCSRFFLALKVESAGMLVTPQYEVWHDGR
jgi:hypothetical protein